VADERVVSTATHREFHAQVVARVEQTSARKSDFSTVARSLLISAGHEGTLEDCSLEFALRRDRHARRGLRREP
jgi:hypothetical protein